MMKLSIGKRVGYIACLDVADAVNQYSRLRNASDEGASTWPDGKIHTGGDVLRISYNGTVWRLHGQVVKKEEWSSFGTGTF